MTMTTPTMTSPAQPYQPGPEYYLAQQPPGLDVKDLLSIFRRRRRVILSSILLLTALAVLGSLQITPQYTASALIMIDPRRSNVVDTESVIQGLGTDASTVESQIRVIGSRFQLERLARRFSVVNDPEFNPALRQPERGVDVQLQGVAASLLGWLPDSWLIVAGLAGEPALTPLDDGQEEFVSLEREQAIEDFASRFKVVPEGRSYVIKLSFTSKDPRKAARIANGAAELYVDALREEKVGKTERSTRWLADRLDELRREVEAAESAVELYRIKHNVTEAQGVSLNEARLFELNQKLSDLRADYAGQMAKVSRIKTMRGLSLVSLEAVPEVLASMTIINLREREAGLLREESELRSIYGARHPRIQTLQEEKASLQAKVQAEVTRIIKTIENEGDIAAERIRALEAEIDTVKQGTTQDRGLALELRELEREAEASKSLYTTFLQRYKETEEQSALIEADAKVVSTAAAPTEPSTPGPILFGAVGFTAATMLGTLLALLLEQLDRGIRSAKQVEELLGLRALALVPRLDRLRRRQKPHQYLLTKPLSAYAESLRGLYTSLQLTDVDNPPRTVLVTSALPQEGKSTLALSLATFAANHSNRKVLLVDVDLRHPSVHRDLKVQPQQGLVEFIAGERSLDEVLAFDEASNLHYLPIRRQTASPTALLGSPRMEELFATLRERFDFIVLDAAPLIGVTDSKIAALKADCVLFTMRWGHTNKETANSALAHLREVKANIAGVVLTLVDVHKHAQYNYGDIGQYYGKYKKYYAE